MANAVPVETEQSYLEKVLTGKTCPNFQDYNAKLKNYIITHNTSNPSATLEKVNVYFDHEHKQIPVVDFEDKKYVEDTITLLNISKGKLSFDFQFSTYGKVELEITPSNGLINKVKNSKLLETTFKRHLKMK